MIVLTAGLLLGAATTETQSVPGVASDPAAKDVALLGGRVPCRAGDRATQGHDLGSAGSRACDDCHGQPPDGTSFPNSAGSHATHVSGVYGPAVTDCYICHATPGDGAHQNGLVSFASGVDTNGNGNIDLSEADVCDGCHSPDGAFDGVAEGRAKWATATRVSCEGCHDMGSSTVQGVNAPPVAGDNVDWGFFTSGHGRGGTVTCTDCHDAVTTHIDGQARTYAFDSAYYGPSQSGVAYAAGYRLLAVSGEVPLMIPGNYNITFGYDAQLMKNTAFRLCFDCHDPSQVFDDTPGNGIDSNFKASLPNPPRNYSYAWGSADVNEHVAHILNYVLPAWDSDWDTSTIGPGGQNGQDCLTTCSSCHNVHGGAGNCGSTNEAMVRDGTLAGRTGYGFSYVVEDIGSGGYPWVTSTGATQATSVGAILRYNTADMCGGSMCHDDPTPPSGCSYDATGSAWGTYLEYYRPWADYTIGACCNPTDGSCTDGTAPENCLPPLQYYPWTSCADLDPPCGHGACCEASGACVLAPTEADCASMGGTWQGLGIPCDPNPCPQPGACCHETQPYCTVELELDCTATGGTYLGDATVCGFEFDCNTNGIPDDCDIARGTSQDINGDGIPDECECHGDANCDGSINFMDIEFFVAALAGENDWEGLFGGGPSCGYMNNDANWDGMVNLDDIGPFVALLGTTCP